MLEENNTNNVEDRDLWIEYRKTGSLKLREKIIIKYIPLVKYVVGKMICNLPSNVEYDDLVEYGIVGLLDAIDKFDITKNINFKTYSITRVRGAIYDELRMQDWVPRSVRKMAKDIERAYIELEKNMGRAATDQEVADFLGVSTDEVNEVFSKVNVGNVSSLDDIVYESDDSSTSLGDTIEDKNQHTPHENLEKAEIKNVLVERLKELSDKEKMVITLYYYEDLTLKEIGAVMDISESRVSQIHSKAILKMRAKLATKFKDYESII